MGNQKTFFSSLISKRKLNGKEDVAERGNMSLWYFLQDFINGDIQLPPHQRDKSWSDERDYEYFETLCNDNSPPGNLEFYHLVLPNGRKSPKNLNDGSQRLRAAKRFYNQCEDLGISKEDAKYILKNTHYSYTCKTHASHQEALKRFQLVNNNLQLTSYQLVIGDIIYCEGVSTIKDWQNFIDEIHHTLSIKTARIVSDPLPSEKSKIYIKNLHALYRHNLSLFCRYLQKDRSPRDYKIGNLLSISDTEYFERELAMLFKKSGLVAIRDKWDEFCRFIDNEIALIESAWSKTTHSTSGRYPNRSTVRWILDVAIWRKFNEYDSESWYAFLIALLCATQGSTTIYYKDKEDNPKRQSISLSRISIIHTLQNVVGVKLVKKKERANTNDGKTKRKGWHRSHINPVRDHGEGETFLEPAQLNLERGAKPVT